VIRNGSHFEQALLETLLSAGRALSTFTALFPSLRRGHDRPRRVEISTKLIHPCVSIGSRADKATLSRVMTEPRKSLEQLQRTARASAAPTRLVREAIHSPSTLYYRIRDRWNQRER
jgi:hypothetical protein